MTTDGRRQRALGSPAEPAKPRSENRVAYAQILGPLGDRLAGAVQGDEGTGSTVASLLPWRCPAAIAGRVATVVLDAIQRPARRPLAHVGQKVREHQPPITDSNPSAAPLRVAREAFSSAALDHAVPGVPRRRAAPIRAARS